MGYHIRLKGILPKSVEYLAKEKGVSPFEFYTKLYNSETLEFNLTAGKVNCKYSNKCTV